MLGTLWLTVSEWWSLRGEPNYEDEPHRRPVTRGVLICDLVDMPLLTSVATQTQVDLDPKRIERGSGSTTSANVEGGKGLFKGRFGRDQSRDQREFYELTQDPNALLVKVLGKLDESLNTTLEEVWETDLLSDNRLDDIIRTAKQTPEIETARDAIRALQQGETEQRIRETWAHAAQSTKFVLVESMWRVTAPDAEMELPTTWLFLTKLRVGEHAAGPYYGNPPEYATLREVPRGVAMRAEVTTDLLTPQGRARLKPGAEIKAGVFGVLGAFDEKQGSLTITPTAIFARVES